MCHHSEETIPLPMCSTLLNVFPEYVLICKHEQKTLQKYAVWKTHLHYYCCINRTTNMKGKLFLEHWRQRDYCWESHPPVTLWLANRWPHCQTWTIGQHCLHIKSLSEQETLSLDSEQSVSLSILLSVYLVFFLLEKKFSVSVVIL